MSLPDKGPQSASARDVPRSAILQSLQRFLTIICDILGELRGDADEGDYIYRAGTSNPLTYDIYDLLAIINHPVKGFIIKNDGVDTIRFAHNATAISIDTAITVSPLRFGSLLAGERLKIVYNRKKINNIYIISDAGNPAYRMWMLW